MCAQSFISGSTREDQSATCRKGVHAEQRLGRRGDGVGRRGNAVVETALIMPWLLLLFLGVFDFGFYAYAAITTAHAARVAALYTSSSPSNAADTTGACYYALQALQDLPNVGSGVTGCTALPVQVTATAVSGADGAPASSVTVIYQTVPLFPIPGLMGQMTITRTAQMRVQS